MLNLIYIRAAIREATGQELTLQRVKELLLEEGLITLKQSRDPDLIFTGYSKYFDSEEAATMEEVLDKSSFVDRYKTVPVLSDE